MMSIGLTYAGFEIDMFRRFSIIYRADGSHFIIDHRTLGGNKYGLRYN